jgi:hypothetical protein
MKILTATYGPINHECDSYDCTAQVSNKVKNDSLIVRSNNDLVGDPCPGHKKVLKIQILVNNEVKNFSVAEGQVFSYSEKGFKEKLGVFYSNNNDASIRPAILESLNSIKRAAEGKADIYTCMWNSEPENPFVEYIAWTKTHSHLNQLLQIMQLLYVAKEANSYKYVSFLEHDVLYPEGYFDYPSFNNGSVLTNMNYIGMNKNGYQQRGANHEPFHQMTMRYDDAISHCESILENALVTNSGMIEPQTIQRLQWKCINPAIHINHGKHFTSHFSIYRVGNESDKHDYWGDHSKFKHLFK